MHHWSWLHTMGPSGTTSRSSSGAGIPWTKQLVLSWSRVPQARLRDTWALLGSHICINAGHLPPPVQWSSTLGMDIWLGNLDIRRHLLPQDQGHQNVRWSTNTAPTLWCRKIPKFGRILNEFWKFCKCLMGINLEASVQPIKVDQWMGI